MIRPQLRQIALRGDRVRLGISTAIRPFSVSRAVAAEGQDQPSRQNGASQSRPPSSPRGPPRGPRTSTKPSAPGARRPAKVIDARSFAAPRAGGDSPKVIRNPRLRNTRGGNQAQGKPQGSKSKPAASKGAKGKGRKQSRPRGTGRFDANKEEEAARLAEFEQIEKEQIVKARPTPVRYEPQDIDFSTLKETWPSLPTDANARSAAVLEKLSTLSGRIPGGYVPPYELARRIWQGQSVLFESEAEKAETMEEVKRLAQVRADKLSQRKGELVEPRDVKFGAINAEDTKKLMETFAQGKYPTLEAGKDQPAVLGEVMRNLRNNGTYVTASKRPQFLAKVESLLSSARVKRT